MELIVINENKLKIMMNKADMERFELDENEFYLSITDSRKILNRILSDCPIRTGFEKISPSDKILIQLYPEKGGGCELFVTKIELESELYAEGDEIFMPSNNDERLFLTGNVTKKSETRKNSFTYSFIDLENTILACKELQNKRFCGKSSLYKHANGRFYLILGIPKGENEKSSPISFLSEFGELENTERASLSLSEYGICIIEQNAVEQLGEI